MERSTMKVGSRTVEDSTESQTKMGVQTDRLQILLKIPRENSLLIVYGDIIE